MDTQVQRLLSREISSMENLRHPNVLHLYEVVETPSRLHLVLEYAGGGDLHNKICNEGKLSDNASKVTFAQILSAIKYMVRAGPCRPPSSQDHQFRLAKAGIPVSSNSELVLFSISGCDQIR